MESEEQGHQNGNDRAEQDRLELLEYRLAERVHGRVWRTFWFYIVIVVGGLVLVGGGLIWGIKANFDLMVYTAKSDIENTKKEVQRRGEQIQRELDDQFSKLRESEEKVGREIRILAQDLKEASMADRADIKNFRELEREARLGTECPSWPTVAKVTDWLEGQQGTRPIEGDVDSVVAVVRRYNICDLQQLSVVLTSPRQKEVGDLYRSILGREPDIYGKIIWIWRLDHGFSKEWVERMIRESDEARQRGR